MKRTITIAEAAKQTGLKRHTVAARRRQLGLGKTVKSRLGSYWVLSAAEVRKIVNCRPEGYTFGRPKKAKP